MGQKTLSDHQINLLREIILLLKKNNFAVVKDLANQSSCSSCKKSLQFKSPTSFQIANLVRRLGDF